MRHNNIIKNFSPKTHRVVSTIADSTIQRWEKIVDLFFICSYDMPNLAHKCFLYLPRSAKLGKKREAILNIMSKLRLY